MRILYVQLNVLVANQPQWGTRITQAAMITPVKILPTMKLSTRKMQWTQSARSLEHVNEYYLKEPKAADRVHSICRVARFIMKIKDEERTAV